MDGWIDLLTTVPLRDLITSNTKNINDRFKKCHVTIETVCTAEQTKVGTPSNNQLGKETFLSMYHLEVKVSLHLHMNVHVQGMYAQMWPIDIPNCHL